MKKFLLALGAVAALAAGCNSAEENAEIEQRYLNTWYEVTKFVGDKPVERWYVHYVSNNRINLDVTIEYPGRYDFLNVGENVKVLNVTGVYGGPVKHEILLKYTE